MTTAIVTDSSSSISQAEAQQLGVFVLPMPVIIDGHAYYEGTDLLSDQFFRALAEHRAVSTSQPSAAFLRTGSRTGQSVHLPRCPIFFQIIVDF